MDEHCNCENLHCDHGDEATWRPCSRPAAAARVIVAIGKVCAACWESYELRYRDVEAFAATVPTIPECGELSPRTGLPCTEPAGHDFEHAHDSAEHGQTAWLREPGALGMHGEGPRATACTCNPERSFTMSHEPPCPWSHSTLPKPPRCFDCGGIHDEQLAEGRCVFPKILLAATRAAGPALTEHETASLRWLAFQHAQSEPVGFWGPAVVAAIAGLFERAAARIEAAQHFQAIVYEGRSPWWEIDALGSQARDAGMTRAVRCRACGCRWEYGDETIHERCPRLACKFGGGEVRS